MKLGIQKSPLTFDLVLKAIIDYVEVRVVRTAASTQFGDTDALHIPR